MRLRIRVGIVAASLIAAVWSAATGAATGRRVTFTTDDGIVIVATEWDPAAAGRAAILLVHAPSRSRHDWDGVGEQLAERGFVALALDLRGHGESEGHAAAGGLSELSRDVAAALRYLRGRGEPPPGPVGILAASGGATLAVLAAAQAPDVRAFALLSATLDFRGLRLEDPFRWVAERPVLLVASNEDGYAVRSARALAAIGPGPRELVLVEGAGHGTRMLATRPELLGVVVDWFARTLL